MNIVKLHDKTFELFISDNEISDIVDTIADKINKSGIVDPLFVAVLNGSFLFAADIMRRVNLPNAEISFIKLASYLGTESTGDIKELIGFNQDISRRNIIILTPSKPSVNFDFDIWKTSETLFFHNFDIWETTKIEPRPYYFS